MAWVAPKTNWANDAIANTDMNRIEGNFLEVYNQGNTVKNTLTTLNNNSATLKTSLQKLIPVAFTLYSGSWVSDTSISGFSFRYTVSVTGLTSSNRTVFALDLSSLSSAISVGLMSEVQSTAGVLYFYSKSRPTTTLTGNYIIS